MDARTRRSVVFCVAATAGLVGALLVWQRRDGGARGVVAEEFARTDAGRAEVEAVESTPQLAGEERVARPDPVVAAKPVVEPSATVATKPPDSFFGRALDDESGAAVAGAEVEIGIGSGQFGFHTTQPAHERVAVTRDDGLFEMHDQSSSGSNASLRAAGYTSAVFRLDDRHATEERALVFRLRRSAEVEVRARDVRTGPIRDAVVRLLTDGYQLAQPEGQFVYAAAVQWRASTNLEGVARLADVASEVPIAIELTPPGAGEPIQFDEVVLARGEKRVIELALGGNSRVTGVLLDERGEPVATQELWLANHPLCADSNPSAPTIFFYTSDGERARSKPVTDEHGRFAIDDVPRGRWWIGPAAEYRVFQGPDDESVSPFATGIDVDGVNALELELHTQRGLFITATVFDPSGKPVAAPVIAHPENGLTGILMGEHVSGDLTAIGPLMPGRYYVYASGAGSDGACDSEPVLVDANARNVALRLRPGGTLRGTTIDAATREPIRCVVHVSQMPREFYMGAESDGSFEIRGVPAGRYDVVATTLDGRCAIARGVVASAGGDAAEIELALQPSARVRVHYEGPQQYGQFMVFDGETIVAADGLHSRTSAVHTVPAGRVRIRMRMGEAAEQVRELDVSIGEEPTVRFTFE